MGIDEAAIASRRGECFYIMVEKAHAV